MIEEKVYADIKPDVDCNINWDHPLSNGLIGCWLFNERAGNRTKELVSGQLSTITKGAGSWSSSKYNGSCYDFDGANTLITHNSSSLFNAAFAGRITVFIIVNLRSVGEGTGGYLFSKGEITVDAKLFRVLPTNAIQIYYSAGVTALERISSANALPLNVDTKITYTGDGSTTASNYRIYVNGVEVTYATTVNGSGLADPTGKREYIGNTNDNSRTTDGKICALFVWRRILSRQEIIQLNDKPYQFLD